MQYSSRQKYQYNECKKSTNYISLAYFSKYLHSICLKYYADILIKMDHFGLYKINY